jgi:hypothetical protein
MPFRPLFNIQQWHGRTELRSLHRSHLIAESMKLPYCFILSAEHTGMVPIVESCSQSCTSHYGHPGHKDSVHACFPNV